MIRVLLFLMLILPACPACIEAAPVLRDGSQIVFTSRQMGVPIRGEFARFDADVRFDPKDVKGSGAAISIDIGSIDAGSDDATVEIKRRTWLDAAGHPRAEFVSSSLAPLGPGLYRVAGKMTIKGTTREVAAPFSAKKEKDNWLFEGKFVLKRLDFNIGEGAWADTDTVDNEVEVAFKFYVPVSSVKNK